jgi:hypothetical protein
MVSAIGMPIVDYKLAQSNQAQLLAQFQKSPDYAQAVSYYQANIGKVTSVDQLLGDRRLLTVALSAFQLESQVDNTGLLRKLLSQDPTQSGSLAQQLLDPRFTAFAKAFSSLRTDSGTSIHDPININSVLAGYQTNEYEKWVSSNDSDPSLRQAMYFERTVQDTIDVSSVGSLYAQFQQSPDIAEAVNYYKSKIGNVTSASDLTGDPKLLDVLLSSFKIDPTTVTTDQVTQLLTEDSSQSTSLAQQQPRFLEFAQALSALKTDGGATLHNSTTVDAVITGYETNQFEQKLGTDDSDANVALFGTIGTTQISALMADFLQTSGVKQSSDYYRANIGKARSVNDLIDDQQLLAVALGAFNIDSTSITTDQVTQLLTQDPTSAGSLARQDPRFQQFAQAFAGLNSNGGLSVSQTNNVDAIVSRFQSNRFEAAIGSKLQQATGTGTTNSGSANLTIYQVLSDATLSAVVRGAVGLPDSVGALDVDQQITALSRAGFDVKQLQDPASVAKLVDRFLANAGLNSTANTDPSGLSALFGASGDGGDTPIPIDLSFLAGGSTSDSASSGSLVNLFA